MRPLSDRLPLVIGVTGHRDLRDGDLPRLQQEISSIIARLRRDYLGQDSETPVIVLSALAEGADRIAARAALALGEQLIAPLPMPPDEYRRDFEPGLRPGAADEFDRLLEQAIAAPIVPFTPGNSSEAARSDPQKRAEQYREVGLFIVRHCHVLIALWDGDQESMAVGGTAEIVKFKREGIPIDVSKSARAGLDGSEIGPVIHVITPRQKSGSETKAVGIAPWGREVAGANAPSPPASTDHPEATADRPGRLPSPEQQERDAWVAFEALVQLTSRFNREAGKLAADTRRAEVAQKNVDMLFETSDKDARTYSAAARHRALAWAPRWCRFYGVADTLAQEWQKKFHTDWWWLFALGLAALICFEIETHILFNVPHAEILFVAYSVFLVIVFIWLYIARREQHQERFLDYRALAEALRVAIFWKLVGIGTQQRGDAVVGCVAEAYPIKQTGELAWVKTCLRTLELLDHAEPQSTAAPILDANGYAWARAIWVGGQLDFFRNKARRHHETAEARENKSKALLGVSVAFMIALLGVTAFAGGELASYLHHDTWAHRGFIFVIGALPGFAAAIVGYTEQLALKAQARQYDRMRMLFDRAFSLLPADFAKIEPAQARELYAELGSEAMKENAEWVAIYRQRPIRAPQA